MTDATRVLLIKPGDLLLIGNCKLEPEQFEPAGGFFRELGVRVAVFGDDIDIAALAAGEIPVVGQERED